MRKELINAIKPELLQDEVEDRIQSYFPKPLPALNKVTT